MLDSSASWPLPPRATGLLLCMITIVVGCDTSFTSTIPSDDHVYSMFGALDPAADTQWIRVEPLAPTTSLGSPDDIAATVTLENVETGQTWQLHDSLMIVQTEPQHNFWTMAPIQPETSYRIEAHRADSVATWAETTTPAHPPSMQWIGNTEQSPYELRVYEIDRLAGLKVRYFGMLGFIHDVSYYDRMLNTNAGYKTYVHPVPDVDRLGILGADSAEVIAAAGGPNWPRWEVYNRASIKDLALPDSFSNVHGGHGMIAGVYRDTIIAPFDSIRASTPVP